MSHPFLSKRVMMKLFRGVASRTPLSSFKRLIQILVEALVAYQKGKPIVALKGTGGTADKIADSYLDDRKIVKVMAAPTPKDAVDQALDHALNGKRGIRYFQSVAKML